MGRDNTMIFKLRFGKWKIVLTLAPVVQVAGVNSTLPDGKNILMWDFDNTPLNDVEHSLIMIQLMEELPNIYILNTGKPNSYIAYCFCRLTWREAVRIVASTPFICMKHLKWSLYRGYFTLRIGQKYGRTPKLTTILPSIHPPTAAPSELQNFVKYLIFEQGYKNRIVQIPHGA